MSIAPQTSRRKQSSRFSSQLRQVIKWGGLAMALLLLAMWVAGSTCDILLRLNNKATGCMTEIHIAEGVASVLHMRFPAVVNAMDPWQFWIREPTTPSQVTPAMKWRPYFHGGVRSLLGDFSFSVPGWLAVTIVLIPTAAAWRLDFLSRRRSRAGLCPHCGYPREGLASPEAPCPECGKVSGDSSERAPKA